MFILGEDISILALSICSPSLNSPSRMRWNKSKFVFTSLSRNGLLEPGFCKEPR